MDVGGEKSLLVKFDPSYRNDLNNWVAEEVLAIKYMEHPQVDSLSLRGEVHYPNLCFEQMEVDFGCILNDTEVIRYVRITNCSPLVVKFRWFFLMDDEENQIRYHGQRHARDLCPSLSGTFPWASWIPHSDLSGIFSVLSTNHCRISQKPPSPPTWLVTPISLLYLNPVVRSLGKYCGVLF